MTDNLRKYFLKPISLILLMSLLFSGAALCETIIDNCKPEMNSSCCMISDDDNSKPTRPEKPCCCEIREATDQQSEATTVLTQILSKILSNDIQIHTVKNINYFDSYELNFRPLSFHSPPNTDLNILNSNFRI